MSPCTPVQWMENRATPILALQKYPKIQLHGAAGICQSGILRAVHVTPRSSARRPLGPPPGSGSLDLEGRDRVSQRPRSAALGRAPPFCARPASMGFGLGANDPPSSAVSARFGTATSVADREVGRERIGRGGPFGLSSNQNLHAPCWWFLPILGAP